MKGFDGLSLKRMQTIDARSYVKKSSNKIGANYSPNYAYA